MFFNFTQHRKFGIMNVYIECLGKVLVVKYKENYSLLVANGRTTSIINADFRKRNSV